MNTYKLINDEALIQSLKTLKRVDDKGYLYEMDVDYDYYPLVNQLQMILDAGCSTFYTKNTEGDNILCRNYDYSHFKNNDRHNPRTALNVIIKANNPKAKYKSIGVCDAFWLDFKHGTYVEGSLDDGVSDISPLILCPYICMDGINEKGIGVSIMALCVKATWEEIEYASYKDKLEYGKDPLILNIKGEIPSEDYIYASDGFIAVNEVDKKAWVAHMEYWKTNMPDKQAVLPPILMRYILDNCGTIDEAIGLASTFNMMAPSPGSAYHIMIVDSLGNSRLLEWVNDKMNIIDINHATNYYVSKDDGFHGVCKRDECIKAGLNRTSKGGMREDYAESLLKLVSQDADTHNDRGKTLYSCIYNTNKLKLRVYSFGDYKKYWDYNL